MTRRSFLKSSVVGGGGLAVATCCPHPWLQLLASQADQQDRILVVLQLSGGNDGLNTVVPFRDDAYYKARPKLALAADTLIKLNDDLGFHRSLASLRSQWESGRLSVIQGVGYSQPNRSHFESMDIWHTCQRKTSRVGSGWLGRWLSAYRSSHASATLETMALHLGHEQQPLALSGRDATVPSIASLAQFRLQVGDSQTLRRAVQELVHNAEHPSTARTKSNVESATTSDDLLEFIQSSSATAIQASQRVEEATRQLPSDSRFPQTQLGEKLQLIAQLIVSQLPTRIYYVTLDGFDTHAQQEAAHASLLRQWADALAAFHKQIDLAGQAERVLVLTFSEFGRRVAENASDGTDHGAAAPLFLSGPQFKQTLVGHQPSLTDLDDGDLKFHIDFRRVYATIIERWFESDVNRGIDSQSVLGDKYEPLELI